MGKSSTLGKFSIKCWGQQRPLERGSGGSSLALKSTGSSLCQAPVLHGSPTQIAGCRCHFFFLLKFLLLVSGWGGDLSCVWVSLHVCVLCMWGPQEGVEFPGTGGIDSYELTSLLHWAISPVPSFSCNNILFNLMICCVLCVTFLNNVVGCVWVVSPVVLSKFTLLFA